MTNTNLSYKNLGRNLWIFQLSAFFLAFGTRCGNLALAWWVMQDTGSTTKFATLIAVSCAAEILAKPLFASFGDLYSRKVLIFICNAVAMAIATAMTIFAIFNHVNFLLVGILLVASSIVIGVRDPLQSSIIPTLVPKERVADAFRNQSLLGSIAMLLGPGFAGILISLAGIIPALGVNLLLITIATGMIYCSKVEESNLKPASEGVGERYRTWLTMTKGGVLAVMRVKVELYLSLLAMVINFSLYPFFTILVPFFVKDHLEESAWYVGVLDSSFGIGIFFASSFGVRFFNKIFWKDISVLIGFIFLGISVLSTSVFTHLYLLPIFFALGGFGLMLININTSVLRSLATPQNFRNRMTASAAFLSALASPIGSQATGLFISQLGMISTIRLFGIAIFCCSFFVLLIPRLRETMRMQESDLEGHYMRIYPHAF